MALEAPALTPQLLLGLTALAVLGIDSVWPTSRNNGLLAGVSVVGTLLTGAVTLWFLVAGTGQAGTGGAISEFGGTLVVDGMSLFFLVIVAAVTTLVLVASYDYVADQEYLAEYYALVLLAATGMSLLAAANSLVTVFVAMELTSLPSYALVAYLRHNRGSVEAGLKYFLVGALSSAVFAYGVSLVYAVSGSLLLADVAEAVADTPLVGVLGVGVLMTFGGFAFKTASVPFHFWAPEVYEGAPAPISAFLSSASKAAGFVVAFRVFAVAFPLSELAGAGVNWGVLVAVLAAVTMTLGNFAAARQEKVKRMLAYSSVGHAGYVLVGLGALGGNADTLVMGAGMTHLLVYGFMNTGAFLFVALTEHWDVGRTFEDFNGLATQAPVACLAMTVFLFSLAGLPVGAGFLSKYLIIWGAVSAGYAWLAVFVLVNSALSLYYYSKVVKAMWIEEPTDTLDVQSRPVGLYASVVAAGVLTVALLVAFDPVAKTAIDAASALL
ncbi:MAG: NADH-quinone oxidoreductase subunit N [Halobacteriaceae archaeon]